MAPRALTVSETDHQDRVVDLLHVLGYIVFHARPARTKEGWRTAVKYDGAGYPDLTAVHPVTGVVLVIECKANRGVWRPEQKVWATAWRVAERENPNVWYVESRPNNWLEFSQWVTTL